MPQLSITLLVGVMMVFWAGIAYRVFYIHPDIPHMESTWWGPGNKGVDDTDIKNFKVMAPPDVITDLKHRLNSTRKLTPPLEGTRHEYGINSNLVNTMLQKWITKYNWTEREVYLNKFPHFKTQIQGLNIHFIHVKPKDIGNSKVVPLLMLHGWPGSVREFYEVIPLLTTTNADRDFVFEVIVPSLPGFGFSDAARKPGCGAPQMAVIFNNLMKRLGFHGYVVHGGDWGASIASYMAILYPSSVLGLHSNFCIAQTNMALLKLIMGNMFPYLAVSHEHRAKMYPLTAQISSFILESGYIHLQATKPDTIGVALTDSPSGLMAYILEKFITLTNSEFKNRLDGGLEMKYCTNKLLDNIMIYWITGSMTSSMRIYAESLAPAQLALGLNKIPITVPSACAKFPHEVVYQTDWILKERFQNLVQSTHFRRGGHFAALEEPELLAGDIRSAVEKFLNLSNSIV